MTSVPGRRDLPVTGVESIASTVLGTCRGGARQRANSGIVAERSRFG